MTQLVQSANRYHYVDALRAFALLLGVVFHASLSFVPVFIGWAVMDVSTSAVVSAFTLVSHSFRMALFFLIAGFLSHLTLHSKGVVEFVRSRLLRIAVPFVVGWFVLRPLLVSGWLMGAESMRGETHVWPAIANGFSTLLAFPNSFLVGSHLWFLYYLLIVTVLLVAVRQLLSFMPHYYQRSVSAADLTMRWLCRSCLATPLLACCTASCLWFMAHWGMDTPDRSLLPHLPVSLIYGGFFIFGWLLHRQPTLIAEFGQLTWRKLLLVCCAIIVCCYFSQFEQQVGDTSYEWLKLTFVIGYGVMMWSLVALSIAIFKRCCQRPNAIVRYLADASYWLYLSHLPVVVWLQVAVADLALHWSIKLLLVSATTVTICLLLYDLAVRSTAIGQLLNGRRQARVLTWPKHPTAVQAFAQPQRKPNE
ncbi:hypothetical protein GCM10011369_24040 [Neiella marina]|uniref:Acyltransferase 3 domain-containing protein n=1 Tax=Neiella marina TaxID=508461 RepID=A0A8J2XPH9_9GAMM|nr:acyltransferase family protein [Neiella marina]GGA81282.1 hypothetical protein GCM10011369_24040 [Neiella marina]